MVTACARWAAERSRGCPPHCIVESMIQAPGQANRDVSLADVHSSVGTAQLSFWRRMFAFAGPAYLVSVGYMDPGNWATDLEGGARFGYRLLWVLVMSNAMAILLQTLSARLGIVTGRDLAQACRETYPRPVDLALWVLCEDRHRGLRSGRGAGRGHRAEPAVPHPAADRACCSPRPIRCCCCGFRASASAPSRPSCCR